MRVIMDNKVNDRAKCEPTYHRYYSLDPFAVEATKEILIVSVCANCGHAIEYRTTI